MSVETVRALRARFTDLTAQVTPERDKDSAGGTTDASQ
jgi:hypothetical protein